MEPISIPSVEKLRERAAEIVAQRDYNLNDGKSDNGWAIALLIEIIDWILVPFRWLFNMMEGLPDILRWTIVLGLAALALLLIVHIGYSLTTAIRGPKRVVGTAIDSHRRGVNFDELERLAREAAGRSDFVTAIRFLFRASIVRLEVADKKSNRPGTTNRELLRRYRNRPEISDALRQFVETIDRKWYGDETCSDADFSSCELAHGVVCRAIREPLHAVGT